MKAAAGELKNSQTCSPMIPLVYSYHFLSNSDQSLKRNCLAMSISSDILSVKCTLILEIQLSMEQRRITIEVPTFDQFHIDRPEDFPLLQKIINAFSENQFVIKKHHIHAKFEIVDNIHVRQFLDIAMHSSLIKCFNNIPSIKQEKNTEKFVCKIINSIDSQLYFSVYRKYGFYLPHKSEFQTINNPFTDMIFYAIKITDQNIQSISELQNINSLDLDKEMIGPICNYVCNNTEAQEDIMDQVNNQLFHDFDLIGKLIQDESRQFLSILADCYPSILLINEFTQFLVKLISSINICQSKCFVTDISICQYKFDGIFDGQIVSKEGQEYYILYFLQHLFKKQSYDRYEELKHQNISQNAQADQQIKELKRLNRINNIMVQKFKQLERYNSGDKYLEEESVAMSGKAFNLISKTMKIKENDLNFSDDIPNEEENEDNDEEQDMVQNDYWETENEEINFDMFIERLGNPFSFDSHVIQDDDIIDMQGEITFDYEKEQFRTLSEVDPNITQKRSFYYYHTNHTGRFKDLELVQAWSNNSPSDWKKQGGSQLTLTDAYAIEEASDEDDNDESEERDEVDEGSPGRLKVNSNVIRHVRESIDRNVLKPIEEREIRMVEDMEEIDGVTGGNYSRMDNPYVTEIKVEGVNKASSACRSVGEEAGEEDKSGIEEGMKVSMQDERDGGGGGQGGEDHIVRTEGKEKGGED